MLGIGDPMIVLGYVLSIALAAACIAYGWINRNAEGDGDG